MFRYISLFLLAACGGFSSGLPGDSNLSALTGEEVCTLVEAEADFSEGQLSDDEACYIGAQFAAALATGLDPDADYAAACTEAFDSCGEGEEVDPDEPQTCTPFTYDAEGCTATVEQYEACTEATIEALKDQAALECTEPTDTTEEPVADANCAAVATCMIAM